MDYLEKMYIAEDGASWIKAGCGLLEKAHFVLDKIHMEKYIQRSVVHFMDKAEETKNDIYEAIYGKEQRRMRKIFRQILGVTEKESKREEIKECLEVSEEQLERKIRVKDAGSVWGCYTEGEVSQVLSS